ncbi:acyl-CoA synthetase [Halomarina salina]|uniref:Acyl-CoA synthetase n=1 Tax=Halomarina salina TaxID=1872699 RepID=A0ABD5RV24_9EURY|nr:AMP-binding protein [Halomarina salina]
MTWYVTLEQETYDQAVEEFSWDILPENYNIARDHLRKHNDPRGRVALFQAYHDGRRETYTFHDLDRASNKVAHALEELGVGFGDRVAIVCSQRPEFMMTAYACWKLGAVTVPCSILTGEDGLQYRLEKATVKTAVVSQEAIDTVNSIRESSLSLEQVIQIDGEVQGDDRQFSSLLDGQSACYEIKDTDPDTPAMIIFTSGTTSKPKGVLHSHGKGVNACPAAYMEHNRDIIGKSVFWSPADWVWIAGFANAIVPAFHYGRPIVGYPKKKFDPEYAYEIIEEFGVTDTLLTATAIQKMRTVNNPTERYDLALDVIHSGGEPVPVELYEWVDQTFDDVDLTQGYGLTEAQPIVANCPDWFEPKPGTIGKPVPGYDVRIIDPETGEQMPRGDEGMIAVRDNGEPGIFKGYIDDPTKTEEMYLGDWLLSGDLATRDEEGYIWFESRDDDVIITSGYRVAAAEVEAAVGAHEAVEVVGVVGKPDETRNEVIQAFVQLAPDANATEATKQNIRKFVKNSLARYEYPHEIVFVGEIPITETDKVDYQTLRQWS